jgi:alpha-tubulin suppressor-like RCC1 family protein
MKNRIRKILKLGDSWTCPANVKHASVSVIARRAIGSAVGQETSLAVNINGDAYSWGYASDGALGNGTMTPDQTTPSLVAGGYKFTQVSAAAGNGYGITTNGDAYAWGDPASGQLGNGTTTVTASAPALVLGGYKFVMIAGFSFHAAAITTDGAIYTWGSANDGRLGNGTTTPAQTTPVLVLGGHTWKYIGQGPNASHTLAITQDGDVYAWGDNSATQIGDGSGIDQTTPTLVAGGHKWSVVATGANFSGGVTEDGDLYCWGGSSSGKLGNGTTTQDETTPALVLGGRKYTHLSLGSSHALAIDVDGDAYAWGGAANGKLGNGTTTPNATTPSLVLGGHKWVYISAGSGHSFGIDVNGDMYAWGGAANGRLGNGTTTIDRTTPTLVLGGHRWAIIDREIVARQQVKVTPGDTYEVSSVPWNVTFGLTTVYQTSSRGFWVEVELEYEA